MRCPVAFRVHTTHSPLFYPSSIVSLLVHQSLVNQETMHLLYHLFSAGAALLRYSNAAPTAGLFRYRTLGNMLDVMPLKFRNSSKRSRNASRDHRYFQAPVSKLDSKRHSHRWWELIAEPVMRNSWSNYFCKQGGGKTEDEKYAKAMWKAIASPNFKITVTCATSDNAACKHGRSASKTLEPPSKSSRGIED